MTTVRMRVRQHQFLIGNNSLSLGSEILKFVSNKIYVYGSASPNLVQTSMLNFNGFGINKQNLPRFLYYKSEKKRPRYKRRSSDLQIFAMTDNH